MQISTRLSMAIHIIVCINICSTNHTITSTFLSKSLNVNPVVIRKLISQLKAAKLVDVSKGKSGITLTKDVNEINIYDLYIAVDSLNDNQLFNIHANLNQSCPVGKNISSVISKSFGEIQRVMEEKMQSIYLDQIVDEIKENIGQYCPENC